MAEETMPTTEGQETSDEIACYECAFHILPTVAEEEVPSVVLSLKEKIEKAGGVITNEEAPEHFDLAYDISLKVSGENRTFNASSFGWVRFTLKPEALPVLEEDIREIEQIFRHLTTRLTREEEAEPFLFFKEEEEPVSEDEDSDAEKEREEEESPDA